MIVIKRNHKAQAFSKSKLIKSITSAFKICDSEVTTEILDSIYDKLVLTNGIRTEDIQKQIENALMSLGFYNEARFFIIYRHINYYENYTASQVEFINKYLGALNAASGSKYDANANVTEKNLATLSSELYKGDTIKLNRYRLSHKIEQLYSKELAKEYIRQLETHELYKHDESSILPYCVAITMYPFLTDGLKNLGGLSASPKNIDSFCGIFVNLVFAVSAQFAGAVATGEFLMYFDYFARKEWGNDYYKNYDDFYVIGKDLRYLMSKSGKWFRTSKELASYDFEDEELNTLRDNIVSNSTRSLTKEEIKDYVKSVVEGKESVSKLSDNTRTIKSSIIQYFQHIVYSINQPAAARSYQSVFWNISYFDKYYFDGLFHNFVFPDGTAPTWNSVNWLQKEFMRWFNEERTKTILTFPVETVAMLTSGDDIKDKEWADFTAEMWSKGHSFFCYLSDNPDSLSSCCRLRNEVADNQFSYSLGAGGIATGSKSVMTLNLNRLVQDAVEKKINYVDYLRTQVQKVHKYQTAFNELLKEYETKGALQVYNAGYISLSKQYLTIGINGMVEAAEFLGIQPNNNQEYNDFVDSILEVLYEENKKARTKELMFNTEFVPAENLGVKHYKWDKEAGYKVPESRNCYNSYFYASEDKKLTILDKFKLHGKNFVKYLDGGSALHMNLEEHLSKDQYRKLLSIASVEGTNYFTFNVPNTVCNKCGHIDKRYLKACPECGSNDIDYATRIIGYLKRISNFSKDRQLEASKRAYYKPNKEGIQ